MTEPISNERLAEMLAEVEIEFDNALSDAEADQNPQLAVDPVGEFDLIELRSILTELQSRRQSLAGVGVKALEWSSGWGTIKAETLIGHYFIDDNRDGGLKVRLEDNWSSWASSSEAAKAAAQADYERRILSSLSVKEPEGVEPAAWTMRINYGPDGEANYANVYSGTGEFVGNLKVHHAGAIVDAFASPPPKAVTITDAARDVLTERRRQIEAEGWTPEHDDQHANGEMAAAAACYAFSAARSPHNILNTVWPWSLSWWKPKDKRRDLVKAAALILAEIERLDRAAALSSEAHNGREVE